MKHKQDIKEGKTSSLNETEYSSCTCITAVVREAVEEYHALVQEFKTRIIVTNTELNKNSDGFSITAMNTDTNLVADSKGRTSGSLYVLFSTSAIFVFSICINSYFKSSCSSGA